MIPEATCIIEHLQANHPGPNVWIPDGEEGRRVRFLDRFFDLNQGNMQRSVDQRHPARRLQDAWRGARPRRRFTSPTTGWRRTCPTANGRSATHSRWPIARPRRPCSTPTGSSEIGDRRGRSSPPIAQRLLAHPAVSRAVEEAPALPPLFPARRARPRLSEGARASAAADRPRSPAGAWLRGCGRRRCGRGDSGGRASNSACEARAGRRRRQARAPPAPAARPC